VNLLQKLRGTISSIFQLGVAGPLLKSVSSRDVEVRTNADDGYGGVKAATVTFTPEYSNGNSGAAAAINWALAQKQSVTLSEPTVTLTFSAPPGPGNFLIRLIQDGAGARAVTWPVSLKWVGGSAPALSVSPGAIDIASFYFDGSVYYGVASLNFA